jgi:hypothetical protein
MRNVNIILLKQMLLMDIKTMVIAMPALGAYCHILFHIRYDCEEACSMQAAEK